MGHLVERNLNLNEAEDPVAELMAGIAGRSREIPTAPMAEQPAPDSGEEEAKIIRPTFAKAGLPH